tara:strand:+ start:3129 stop:4175 length:1047 start_codon:yes stop_codon:yes gene_type:complete
MVDNDSKIIINDDFLNKKGLCGINNLGNTCFMNSILQCLSNTIPLTKYFLENNYKDNLNNEKIESVIAKHWNTVLRSLWNKNGLITPNALLGSIQNIAIKKGYNEFTGLGQNDCQEFLQFFLEILHNAFSREVVMKITGEPKNAFDKIAIEALESWKKYFNNDYSLIIDVFYGQFMSEVHTICNGKESISKTYDPFNTLSLEIIDVVKDDISIYDCLDNFTKNENIDIDDSSKKIFKRIQFWKLPKRLVIFFKKFNNKGNKINKLINFPLEELDMSKYVVGYNRDKYKYDLYGITNHIGGTGGGHYFSYVKNFDKNWYKYNDSVVSTLKIEQLVSKDAYCLFYKLKNT